MSEKNHYFSSGVFKVDKKYAGYKDLFALAQEWKKDENFYELIVRNVSEENYGVQFVYYKDDHTKGEDPISNIYKQQLKDLYGSGFYARDVLACGNASLEDYVIVLKSLK